MVFMSALYDFVSNRKRNNHSTRFTQIPFNDGQLTTYAVKCKPEIFNNVLEQFWESGHPVIAAARTFKFDCCSLVGRITYNGYELFTI